MKGRNGLGLAETTQEDKEAMYIWAVTASDVAENKSTFKSMNK